jgi:hypothetical protein
VVPFLGPKVVPFLGPTQVNFNSTGDSWGALEGGQRGGAGGGGKCLRAFGIDFGGVKVDACWPASVAGAEKSWDRWKVLA